MKIGNNNPDLGKRFIESVNFPFSIISEASEPEKGPGRPPHWEMVFWWTRKPLISARAIIAGCLLPENTSPTNFFRSIGIIVKGRKPGGKPVFKITPHRVKPELKFSGIKLLDPFAGFGSIPLEGLRLGLGVTAVELLPAAYVFLKAVLEYPAKYGKQLVHDVEKWGRWVTERLKEDPLIRELYDEDVAVYIGSWEVKCPHCGRWTPLVGNWWLARVKAGEGYERLAWMEPVIEGDEVKIQVVDLNKISGDEGVKDARVSGLRILANGKEFRVPESNIEARREKAICLLCHQPIMQVDPQTGKHYTETKNLPKEVRERLEGYVKYAIKTYNQSLEGGSAEVLARQRLLVKVKVNKGDLEFEPYTEKDQEKLALARKEVEKMLREGDPDIPREGISLYSVRYLFPILYGMTEWYKLFNPRQLLTLVKLVKLIREAGRKLKEEKQREGQTQEEAHKYTEAVTTYLAIALCKYANYNSLVNVWNPSLIMACSLSMRGLAMMWNWYESIPWISWTGTYMRNVDVVVESLRYLINTVSGSPSRVEVVLDDATILGKLDANEKFDLIVSDPPYYDDVPYAELSDFYYVWLKRVLSDVENGKLVQRFLPEAFFERVGDSWIEVSTQWEKYALSEVSLNPPRIGADAKYEDGVKHFQNLINSSFITMTSRLKDDGLLVTYYAHTDPDAWKALLEAGWEAAGLMVTNAFSITTESAQSVVKRGKLSMDTSIVVVWRKGCQGPIEASELYVEMVEEASERAKKLLDRGIIGRDLIIGTLAAALAVATRYREIRVMGKIDVSMLVDKYVYPATYLGLAKAFAGKADLKESVKTPDGMFYLIVKSTVAGAKKKILESTDARIFSIGTSLDLNSALKDLSILKAEEKEGGAKVAKAKALRLLEPTFKESSKLAEFLEVRGIGVTDPKIRCSVDALHLLEYWAIRYSREDFRRRLEEVKVKYPVYVEDALNMARIMARVLPNEDLEKELCVRMVKYLEPPAPGLSKFVKQGEE
ncbi:MAG: DUF1156 domain-containing protein [Thermoproteota archaeon]